MRSLLLLVLGGLATGVAAGVPILGTDRLLAMRSLLSLDLATGLLVDLAPERQLAAGCVAAALLLFLRDAWLGWRKHRQMERLRARAFGNFR